MKTTPSRRHFFLFHFLVLVLVKMAGFFASLNPFARAKAEREPSPPPPPKYRAPSGSELALMVAQHTQAKKSKKKMYAQFILKKYEWVLSQLSYYLYHSFYIYRLICFYKKTLLLLILLGTRLN